MTGRIGIAFGGLLALVVVWAAAGAIVYSPTYVGRVLTSGQSEFSDYVDGFPLRAIPASSRPAPFASDPDEDRVRAELGRIFGVDDLEAFLADADSQAFVVIADDAVIYERYFGDTTRDSMLTSFSVAKSFVSVLVGIAIDEGHIGSVDDPITTYLPELSERDPAFEDITIRDLLRMASGLEYMDLRWWLLNGDDPLTTFYPDQREIALTNTHIVEGPGEHFDYNKYHAQLLGMILERATGVSVTEFTRTRLWEPIGAEFDAAWALDSEESGFEKMESGFNARAIDYAKLGRLMLDGGRAGDTQVVSAEWLAESTALDPATHTAEYYSRSFSPHVYDGGAGYYAYMWYGMLRTGAPSDVVAEGDRGQIIFVSPANGVVIVRNGTDFGIPLGEWVDAFFRLSDAL
jgi:CubicO group peptidase (beta-lactamase class C family)